MPEPARPRVALIAGGSGGIGRAVAARLVAMDVRVALLDRDAEALDEAVADPALREGRVHAFVADVTDPKSVSSAIGRVVATIGEIDLLSNNAGILGGPRVPESDLAHALRAVSVNLSGAIVLTELVARQMRGRGGSIVHTASTAGLVPHPFDPVYAATKAGLVNFVRSLAYLHDDGIRVNSVCPGLTTTGLERHTALMLPAEQREAYLNGRAAHRANPYLDPAVVAATIVAVALDTELAGMSVVVTAENGVSVVDAPIDPHAPAVHSARYTMNGDDPQ